MILSYAIFFRQQAIKEKPTHSRKGAMFRMEHRAGKDVPDYLRMLMNVVMMIGFMMLMKMTVMFSPRAAACTVSSPTSSFRISPEIPACSR